MTKPEKLLAISAYLQELATDDTDIGVVSSLKAAASLCAEVAGIYLVVKTEPVSDKELL